MARATKDENNTLIAKNNCLLMPANLELLLITAATIAIASISTLLDTKMHHLTDTRQQLMILRVQGLCAIALAVCFSAVAVVYCLR